MRRNMFEVRGRGRWSCWGFAESANRGERRGKISASCRSQVDTEFVEMLREFALGRRAVGPRRIDECAIRRDEAIAGAGSSHREKEYDLMFGIDFLKCHVEHEKVLARKFALTTVEVRFPSLVFSATRVCRY